MSIETLRCEFQSGFYKALDLMPKPPRVGDQNCTFPFVNGLVEEYARFSTNSYREALGGKRSAVGAYWASAQAIACTLWFERNFFGHANDIQVFRFKRRIKMETYLIGYLYTDSMPAEEAAYINTYMELCRGFPAHYSLN